MLKKHIEEVAMQTTDPKDLALLAKATAELEKQEVEAKKAETEEAKVRDLKESETKKLEIERQKAETEAKKAEVEEIKVQNQIDSDAKKLEIELQKAEIEAQKAIDEAEAEARRLDIEEQKVEESKKSRVWGFFGGLLGALAVLGGQVAVAELKNKGDAEHRADVEKIEKSENIVLNLKKYKR